MERRRESGEGDGNGEGGRTAERETEDRTRGSSGVVFSSHDKEVVVLKVRQRMHVLADTWISRRSIDEIYDALVERLLPVADTSDQTTSKYIVGLAGPPGAGKSTLANEVVRRLNMICPQKAPSFDGLVEASNFATVVPMDGFHLYRSQLDAMEDPDEAHARRGAPWTFDPVRLLECLTTLKEKGSVYVPSFDHGVGDPVEDDIFVGMKQKLVIVEGNYLLLADGVWKDISRVFDEKWFIDIDIEKSMKRVVNRHIATGKAPDVAKWRVEYNDRPNAELIMKSKKNADLVICSVDFNQ
ncbi:putative uridine kinase [Nymphaea thermarum]|nr:putative uridine kinase [Nymphaea thermarum]